MGSSLAGKTALITGGSRGIGRAIVLEFASAGCAIAINYRSAQSDADSVVNQIRLQGGRAAAFKADVSQKPEVDSLVGAVENALGPIDILVNNAGINPRKPHMELTLEDWEQTIHTNLTSAFLASQAVVPGMRQRHWGRLIFLSSIAAQTGGVIGPHYAASKAGMIGLMHSYANLLAKDGITSNAISPALIETDMVRNNPIARPDLIPIGRFGQPDETARAALFLATTGYITGQTINLNGGWYMS
jgi:3-oxoacyl-[acyl-carrier protein] reductase